MNGLISALLEASSDFDINVRKTVSASLIQLGVQYHSLVLSSIRQFLDDTQTTPKAHIQSILYNTTEGIVRECGDKIEDEKLILDWVKASEQLLILPTIAHDLQQAASSFLVSLACTKKHSNVVLNSLTNLLKPEEVPPHTIIETLTAIAIANSRVAACYFKKIMDNLAPYLINIKQDNLRMAISLLLAKYSESVVDAVCNKEYVDTLSLDQHHEQCSFIYDTLMQHWLKSPQVGVRNEVILCLGHMSFLLSKEKLESYVLSLVSSTIGQYKRNPCPFTLTYSLALVCDALLKMEIENILQIHIDSLMNTLFSQVCITPNFNEPYTVKNHCEVLRCFDMLAKGFSEPIVGLLIQRLENASHVQRVGSLLVVKHLINSRSLSTEYVNRLIAVLNLSLGDPNSKVVRNVAQVIVALCHNNHLDSNSGAPFITYLVQHSAGGTLDSRRASLNDVGEEFIGNVCCRALNLLATSMNSAFPLLWPRLLQFVTNLEYQQSFPTILSCLASLLQNPETSSGSSEVPFKEIGSQSAPYIVSHLILMCCSPNDPLGISSLSVLQGLAGHISPNLPDVWLEHLPQLKETYTSLPTTANDPSSIQMWQDSLRDFLGCTIEAINDDSFTCGLISSQMDQLQVWERNQAFRCFLMSAVGVALKHCKSRPLVDSTLDSLFNMSNHKSSAEQESFSLCIGLCSMNQISVVLSHIETWLKSTDTSKRSTLSLFHLLKHQDARSEEATWQRSSLILCLGQIASLASPELVGSYIDGPIMLHLLNIINSNKSELVNDITLQTLSKIAKALLCLPSFQLRQRPLFLTHIVSTIKQENISLSSLTGALQVLRDLVALEPELNVEERTIVLQASLSATLLHLEHCSSSGIDSMLDRCYSQLNVFIRTLIQHDTCPATLDDVTTLLHSWTQSPHEIVRAKALDLLYSSFCTFLQHLVLTQFGPSTFNQTCQLLAMLSPRCADPCREIRAQAIACVLLVLKILARYNGQSPDATDEDITCLKALEEKVKENNEKDSSEAYFIIAKVLCNKLSFVQLRLYLSLVVIGLQDLQSQSGAGVAQILAAVFTLRDSIYRRLEKVSDRRTTQYAVEAVCNLAKHNIVAVIDAIMLYPVPYERCICETLQRIGCESDLCGSSLTHLTHILERSQFFTDHQTATQEDVKIASLSTLTAICSMKELLTLLSVRRSSKSEKSSEESPLDSHEQILSVSASQQIVNERLPSLMALLLLSYGSYIGTVAPLHQSTAEGSKNSFVPNRNATGIVPSKCALECLQALVSVSCCAQLEEALSSQLLNPHGDTVEDFLNGLSNIALLFVQEAPMHISALVAYLDSHHDHEIQRMTVTAVFGELVAEKCCGDFELLEIITSGLLSRLNDKSGQVRRLAVKGLANFAMLQREQMSDKMSEVVSALVSSTDLREGSEAHMECQVALEALRGLASLLPNLPPSLIVQHAPTLLIRIRLFVEKNSGEVREASMGVLRGLSTSVGSTEEFKEQIFLHLLTAIIHLEDPYPSMVVMCKSALQALGPHLASKDIQKLFEEQLVPSSSLNFQDFVANLTKKLGTDMKDQISLFLQVSSSYFRHTEPTIRRASILFTGYLIHNSAESDVNASLQRLYHGLLYLLRDQEQTVRCAAAMVVPLVAKSEKILEP
ncbi:Maestro heat-like repeat-containing protein family member 1 [Armadillidium nasatum]|uniref:Maestro heat-like repeat-containing protein family member 1 n=1 Tax=Armadillidium nasatum TaxID=96803 RepID=A0A5N5SIE3_9CRUS|nr:Maestro heat-like repeat-containing protein family member 1 [Armadillidium nasatum]